ncbi:MAG: hypothetical protein NC314_09935 [Roseburia sp.]|nr:hypothetical protein [Ruminococcus sp.]MCM1155719.1 hypothetical protein [Roseburia sp.]MCM1243150.1 hypothetical protein [Roseburia sp.]
MNDELKMSVSPVCVKDGVKFAYVSFTDGIRNAEGKIPECTIISNNGFSAEEIKQLEDYMRRERTQLKKMAAGINVLDSFMRGNGD